MPSSKHRFSVSDRLELYRFAKQPGDKFKVAYDFKAVLLTGVTVSSVGSITVSPTDSHQPTAAAAVVGPLNDTVSTVVDAGDTAWNTTGVGRIHFVVTFSNGDTREIDTEVTVVDI